MSDRHLAAAAMGCTVLLWSSAFVAIRVAVIDFGPAGLTLGRLLIASVALAAGAMLLGIRRPARADLPRFAVCGLAGIAGYQFLLNAGERTVEAGTANLLIKTGPVFTALLAWLLLASRPTRTTWAGIVLGFSGAALIAVTHHGWVDISFGALLVLGAALGQGTFFVLEKPLLERYTALEVTCYTTWAACVMALPAAGPLVRALPQTSPSALASMVFLGVGSSAVGFATWSYALARLPVAVAANTLYLTPPMTILIGWIALRETPRPLTVVGGLVVLAGVAVSHRRARPVRRRRPEAESRP